MKTQIWKTDSEHFNHNSMKVKEVDYKLSINFKSIVKNQRKLNLDLVKKLRQDIVFNNIKAELLV